MTQSTEVSESSKRIAEIEKALDNGMYEATDGCGKRWAFGFDDDCTGIYGWRIPFGEKTVATMRCGDDEADAAPAIAEFLDSIPDQIKRAVEAERKSWESIHTAGAMLSNIAFNLSQRATAITERDRQNMRDVCGMWDAAIRARGEAK